MHSSLTSLVGLQTQQIFFPVFRDMFFGSHPVAGGQLSDMGPGIFFRLNLNIPKLIDGTSFLFTETHIWDICLILDYELATMVAIYMLA